MESKPALIEGISKSEIPARPMTINDKLRTPRAVLVTNGKNASYRVEAKIPYDFIPRGQHADILEKEIDAVLKEYLAVTREAIYAGIAWVNDRSKPKPPADPNQTSIDDDKN